ncbi:MAG: hypothetical protein H0T79_04635 [Deltaproteobacteria bacterium]|nr:hypothetical protein [Deltaproteobacteria bacterium]
MTLTTVVGVADGAGPLGGESDEALSTRLRDLALVDLDALISSGDSTGLIAAFADDVHDALREARARIVVLRGMLAGADPLNVLDTTVRQRASDAGGTGAARVQARLVVQAEAARALARLADLAGSLAPKLFEADRRRG